MSIRALLTVLLALALLSGCGDDAPTDTLSMGEAVYRERLADGNTFTCATCHALSEPASDGFVRPGHPLGDATRRSSYKGGRLTDMREAVNSCVTEWMNGAPWSATDARWTTLHAFLDAQATSDTAPAVDLRIVAPPADLSGGDAASGRALFNSRCVVCHGVDAAGTERAPGLTGAPLPADYIASRVRTSGRADSPVYTGLTGGIMPFWSADRLSDAELLDIVAYVVLSSAPSTDGGVGDAAMGDAATGDAAVSDAATGDSATPDAGTDSGARDASSGDAGSSGCAATHARVGQVAMLSADFHGTTGTARIVDDCTIVVEGFGYDGTGIDVRFYGALGRDYGSGFALSDDLLLAGGYDGASLTLTLPPGHTLDEVDSISLWCVAVGVSFGDGSFM